MDLNLLTDVIICASGDAKYMEEFLRYLSGYGEIPLYLYTANMRFNDRTKRYICVRRVPFSILPRDVKLVFVNTEQLTVPKKLQEYRYFTRDPSIEVYDYSRANISISGRGTYLPIEEDKGETTLLKTLRDRFRHASHAFDVACVGSVTPYRTYLVNFLKQAGVRVDFIQGFGIERDRRVAKCKILLNLHAEPSYKLYEPIRCERWRYAGMPIITEPCVDEVPPGVTTSALEDMPYVISTILSST